MQVSPGDGGRKCSPAERLHASMQCMKLSSSGTWHEFGYCTELQKKGGGLQRSNDISLQSQFRLGTWRQMHAKTWIDGREVGVCCSELAVIG